MRVARAIVALVVIGASATARPAAAQEPGVVIDPGSPAGKECAFPLDVQRAAAVGRDAVQGVPQPRFGVGIPRAQAGESGSAGSKAAPGGSRGSGSSRASRRSAGAAAPSRTRAAKQGADAVAIAGLSQPPAITFPVALATLAVVLGGGLIGALIMLVRRRRA